MNARCVSWIDCVLLTLLFFSSITNGNLNARTIMVAKKASDHILGRGLLSPSNLKGFIHPEWQNSQR